MAHLIGVFDVADFENPILFLASAEVAETKVERFHGRFLKGKKWIRSLLREYNTDSAFLQRGFFSVSSFTYHRNEYKPRPDFLNRDRVPFA